MRDYDIYYLKTYSIHSVYPFYISFFHLDSGINGGPQLPNL